jgi:CBS domain
MGVCVIGVDVRARPLAFSGDPERVENRMTCASALLTVPPELGIAAADRLAYAHSVHHLLVMVGGELVGVACRCDLGIGSDGAAAVRDVMARDVYAIHARATLGEAFAAMADLNIGCLPVVESGFVVGVLSRRDLITVGAPAEWFGMRVCRTCGSRRRVTADPHTGADACARCIAEPEPDLSPYDFGEGD